MSENPKKSASKKKSSRPVMVVLDALSRRWSLRVLWELRNGALNFRALREASGNLSPSVLNTRLAELRELGVVTLGDAGYALTEEGMELSQILLSLDTWAKRALKR
jgi:DNA-binding HxlR family transcriptional regulator